MMSIEQMLKIDPQLASLNESELVELRDAMYQMAQLSFEVYMTQKHGGSKFPAGFFPPGDEGATV
jgi:hypothetical protein